MSLPDKFPDWDTNGTHIVEPSAGQKSDGFVLDEVPTSAGFNWQLRKLGQWTRHLFTDQIATFIGALADVTAPVPGDIGALTLTDAFVLWGLDFLASDKNWGGTHTFLTPASLRAASEFTFDRSMGAVEMNGRFFSTGDVAVQANSLPGGPVYMAGQTNGAYVIIALNGLLKNLAQLKFATVRVKPGTSGLGHAMIAALGYTDTFGVVHDLSTDYPADVSDTTTNNQSLTLTANPGSEHTVDISTNQYYIFLQLGDNAAVAPDRIYNVRANCADTYLLDR
jgi:hypothetical protein